MAMLPEACASFYTSSARGRLDPRVREVRPGHRAPALRSPLASSDACVLRLDAGGAGSCLGGVDPWHAANACRPHRMVVSDMPGALDTVRVPPCSKALASAAAHRR